MSVVVLTGVSRGLGKAMAVRLADAGHTVCGCARSEAAVSSLQENLGAEHFISCVDVAEDAAVRKWASDCLSKFGPPELLINNAAMINRNTVLWEVTAGEFDALTAVNINGTANVIRHFVPAMVEREHGVIVNFSSGWGRSVSAKVAPYCGSKWAIEGMTQALAEELPPGMAAVPLNPGIIDTEMLRSCFGEAAAGYPDADEWATRAVPFILNLGPDDNGRPLTVPGG